MTHTKFMKLLKDFSEELQEAANARPYNPDKYNRIIDELTAMYHARQKELRSNAVLRFNKWAIKQGSAGAAWLIKYIKKDLSL